MWEYITGSYIKYGYNYKIYFLTEKFNHKILIKFGYKISQSTLIKE